MVILDFSNVSVIDNPMCGDHILKVQNNPMSMYSWNWYKYQIYLWYIAARNLLNYLFIAAIQVLKKILDQFMSIDEEKKKNRN